MKLILGISIMIRSNYFSLINMPDHLIPAAPAPPTIIHYLHSVSAPPTTATAPSLLPPPTTASVPLPSANRVSTCQMADIRASVWFTKLVLEEQEEEEEEKKKKKKKKRKKTEKKKKREKKKEKENYNNDKNNDNDKNNNNNDDDKLAI
ncbi:hypothetical protein CIHG_08327 [Coccidioides immitis H538.4]|uniref:Uncharacterized protein n=1 Tax=Coccidioides immitis H538.4 TaxID=396776 RepID=A0A0J8S1B0_COCIT|nr:hypothetical protein CIHG_08327 [Coccidioides immitis H538.4]